MERELLEGELAAGRSIKAIARELRRDPSTVAYWVNKHGLTSQHAPKHAARGGIPRAALEELLAAGLPVRAMAERLGVSYTTVRHWLRKHGLVTPRGAKLASTQQARAAGVEEAMIDCPIHGPTRHVRRLEGGMRCLACRSAAVSERRRRVKSILVAERWRVRDLRLRPQSGRAALPPCRSVIEAVRRFAAGAVAVARD